MLEAIAEANVEIVEGNAALHNVMKAAIEEMEPYRRIVGPATRQRLRSTLRAVLNAAIAQQVITFNPAAPIELEAGKRPKPSYGPRSAFSTGSAPARSRRQ